MDEPSPIQAGASALDNVRFDGPAEFSRLIRQAFEDAAEQGFRELVVCDPDFSDWPLGESGVVGSLTRWARQGRKFTMLAGSYDDLQRRHHRFVTWRRDWSHLIDCRSVRDVPVSDFQSLFWSSGWFVDRMEKQRCRGLAGSNTAKRVAMREQIAEYLLRSTPAFPATTLGL